jgi:hypothetical protein
MCGLVDVCVNWWTGTYIDGHWSTVHELCNYAESIGVVSMILGATLALEGVLDSPSRGGEGEEGREVEAEIHLEFYVRVNERTATAR